MRVVIIGAGIGGLVLAHALRRSGITVRVYERDRQVGDTGGYRLHLDGTASAVLARHLRPEVYQALLASSAGPGTFTRFSVFDHRLRTLLSLPRDGGDDSEGDDLLIGRIPLRTLLSHGLDEELRLGQEFTHSTRDPVGVITAHFTGGHREEADVLIGADGARSAVARALAGAPTSHPLPVGGLAGRTALTGRTRDLLPDALRSGPGFAFGPGGTLVFLSVHDPDSTAVDPAECHRVAALPEPAYLLWGVTTAATAPAGADPAALHRHARDLFAAWTPRMRALVDAAEPATITAFPYLASDPATPLAPWPAGPVTAVGDAVHAMPPTGGRGAITAIRDADVLARNLAVAAAGDTTIPLAVHTYHRELREYAPVAVRESLQPLRWQRRLRLPLAYPLARRLLPLAGHLVRA